MMSSRSKFGAKASISGLSTSKNNSMIGSGSALSANKSNTDAQWQVLAMGFEEIYSFNSSNLSFEELYRNGYKMVVAKDGEKLYNNTIHVIRSHLESIVAEKIAPTFPQFLSLHNQNNVASSSTSTPITPLAGKFLASNDELEIFLKTFNKVWLDHLIVSNMIKDVLMYLDRTFLPSRNMPSMFDTCIEVFRETVVASKTHQVKKNVISALIGVVNNFRDGGLVNKSLLAEIFRILSSIPSSLVHAKANNLYDSIFETEFLEASRLYYASESQVLIEPLSSKEYLEQAKRRLDLESQFLKSDLGLMKTAAKIKVIVETELVGHYVSSIIQKPESGLVFMIATERYEDLGLLYEMLSLVPNGHELLRQAVSDHVRLLGKDLNILDQQPVALLATGGDSEANISKSAATTTSSLPFIVWIDKVLRLKTQFDIILQKSFSCDIAFEGDINLALQSIVSLNPKAPEYISLYLDHHLRQVSKGKLGVDEFEKIADFAVSTFRFLAEKDVFERYYKQHLAKRLLYVKSVSEDAERGVLGKLKLECGYQFTSKLEGMFTDSRISIELSTEFKEHVAAHIESLHNVGPQPKHPEVSFNILTSTYWPFTAATDTVSCNLPVELVGILGQFEGFYMSRHSGRRLTWLKNMGTGDIHTQLTAQSKRKELSMSTYCMVILVTCFNGAANNDVSFKEIKAATRIPGDEAKRAVQSLALGKYRILKKMTKNGGRDVLDEDIFQVNLEFTHPLSKIKIPTISTSFSASTSEDAKERAATLEKIATDRRYQIEATVVRVMKSRKTMQHSLLVAQVVEQLSVRFQPDIMMVKKRIEELIERDYLERDESDRTLYHYVA